MKPEDMAAVPPGRLPFPVTRAASAPVEAKADDGAMPTMIGHFATFNQWYEVNSMFEGHFLESVDPRAFDQTIAESRDNMKVLFDHGQDPSVGNKILGPIESLTSDEQGPAYVVPLLDTSYNRDLAPGLKAGLYGSSFRFQVDEDAWSRSPKASDYNPDALPERTITRASVMEFGPVTFPANPNARAAIRSTTDDYYRRSRDAEGFDSLMRSAQTARRGALSLKQRSLDDLAAYLLADPAALSAAIDKLANGEPLMVQEAELLEAAIEHLEPPDADADDEMDSTPPTGEVRNDTPALKGNPTVSDYVSPADRASRMTELRSVLARLDEENSGVLAESAQAEWDSATEELSRHEADQAAYETRQAFMRSRVGGSAVEGGEYSAPTIIRSKSEEDIYDLDGIRNQTRSRAEFDQKVKEHALRSIDGAKLPREVSADTLVDIVEHRDSGEEGKGEIAQRVLLTGSPAYRRYFNKYLKGQEAIATPEEHRAAALAVTGTTTTGGYAVPYVFDPTMIHIGAYTAQNPFREACRVETITNGNNWRAVTVGNIAMAYQGEATALTEGGPTFAQPSYTVQTAAGFVTLSIEAMEDRPDITGELGSVLAEGKATLEENKFAIGAGTGALPTGMFNSGAYTVSLTATNDVTALLDFTTTEGALPLRFRQNAAWFMARSTIRQLQILDTTYRYFSGAQIQFPGPGGVGLLSQGSQAGGNTGLQLLGYPIWEVPSAVSTLTTDAAVIAVLCDPKSYIIVDRLGMNIEVIPQMVDATTSFPTLQRGVVAYFRNTAKPHTADAGRQVKVQ